MGFVSDIKYGFRRLLKSPGFTAIAIVSLALGIGVNTAIFSLLNAVWMRSLPVRNPRELRVVQWSGRATQFANWTGGAGEGISNRSGITTTGSFPYPLCRDFQEQVEGCSDAFAFFGLSGLTIMGPKGALTAEGLMVSGNYFRGYGADALIGRTLRPGDEVSGAEPVAVITYPFWEREFELDPEAIGQMITVNGHQFTIVGVMPRDYTGPQIGDMAQVYVPMSAQPALSPAHPIEARDHWWANIMVRLEPKASEAPIKAAMESLLQQTFAIPGQGMQVEDPHIALVDGSRGLLGIRKQVASSLAILMAAVALVLVIACANLAGLLLARGASRRQELTIRAAMGAGRLRLIRQLLTESLILALVGAGVGLLLAIWIKAVVLGFMPDTLESFRMSVHIDLRVLAFTLGVAGGTALLFGFLPALRATRLDLRTGLKGKRTLGVPSLRLGKVLVAGQVSLSVLLLMGTALLLQTVVNLYRTDLGFNTDGILVFRLNPGQAGYRDANSVRFYDQVEVGLAGLPGVRKVAFSSIGLLEGTLAMNGFSVPGRIRPEDQKMQADVLDVSEGFLETMGIDLLSGRNFQSIDTPSGPRVVVINEALAHTYFPNEDPLGQSIRMGERDFRIIGLCRDAKYNRVQRDIAPTLYFAHRQANPPAMYVEVRTAGDPLTLIPAIRRIVADLDPAIPLDQISTQSQLFRDAIAPQRIFMTLCSSLAALGILLSCVGLYGLLAFMVSRRTGEIGVRLALGATPADVACPIIRNALWLAGFGLAIGIPIALAGARVLRSLLFGVSTHDPIAVSASILMVLSVATLAAWLPARRAARIDPMEALRYE